MSEQLPRGPGIAVLIISMPGGALPPTDTPAAGRINDRMRWGPAEPAATLVPVAEPEGADPPRRL